MIKLVFNRRTRSDIDLELCQKHSDLQVLDMTGSMILGYGFEYLTQNLELRELYLASTPIQNRYMHLLSKIPALQLLDISDTSIDDTGAASIASIQNLKVLIANKVRAFGDSGLDEFSQSPCAAILHTLKMSGTAVSDAGLETIGQLQALKSLSLSSTILTTDGASELASLRHLEDLDLSFTQVGDGAMSGLATIITLNTLLLGGTPVSPTGVIALSKSPALATLSLSLAYGDALLEALVGSASLKDLRLFDGRIDTGMAALKSIKTLRSLELVYVNMSSQALSDLKQLQQLELLIMDDDHYPLKEKLEQALPNCRLSFET